MSRNIIMPITHTHDVPTLRIQHCDLVFPRIAIGAWSFGGSPTDYWGSQAQSDVDDVVRTAAEQGCFLFDTAEAYNGGGSERSLGEALSKLSLDLRSKIILCSKIMPNNCFSEESIRNSLNGSLQRLGVDKFDIYMVHWPINSVALQHFASGSGPESGVLPVDSHQITLNAFRTLMKLQNEGLIRYVGVSNFGIQQLKEAMSSGVQIVLNELPYNLVTRAIEIELASFCSASNIGIMGYCSLAQGLLSGNYRNADEMAEMRVRTRHYRGDRPSSRHGGPGLEGALFQSIDRIRQIAEKHHVLMSSLALAYCASKPFMTTVLVGARNVSQMLENCEAAKLCLSPEEVKELDEATREVMDKMGPAVDMYESVEKCRTF